MFETMRNFIPRPRRLPHQQRRLCRACQLKALYDPAGDTEIEVFAFAANSTDLWKLWTIILTIIIIFPFPIIIVVVVISIIILYECITSRSAASKTGPAFAGSDAVFQFTALTNSIIIIIIASVQARARGAASPRGRR